MGIALLQYIYIKALKKDSFKAYIKLQNKQNKIKQKSIKKQLINTNVLSMLSWILQLLQTRWFWQEAYSTYQELAVRKKDLCSAKWSNLDVLCSEFILILATLYIFVSSYKFCTQMLGWERIWRSQWNVTKSSSKEINITPR